MGGRGKRTHSDRQPPERLLTGTWTFAGELEVGAHVFRETRHRLDYVGRVTAIVELNRTVELTFDDGSTTIVGKRTRYVLGRPITT